MDGVTDGLQVALLGQMRQQSLHAAVEQLIIVKLERKKKKIRKELPGYTTPQHALTFTDVKHG